VGNDDLNVQSIKQYVLARLREELANAPRGAQAQLAKRLGVSGAHLSNMLSSTPSRQPGEDFRRKVAAHWGVTYAQLEALALGEDAAMPASAATPVADSPPNLEDACSSYGWMAELPADVRAIVRAQARQYYVYRGHDFTRDDWHRILSGLEREAATILAAKAAGPQASQRRRRAR
jgi:hypothetical protein